MIGTVNGRTWAELEDQRLWTAKLQAANHRWHTSGEWPQDQARDGG